MLQHSESLDLVFHALADGSRRAMVERLIRGPASTSELAKPLTMSLSAVAQHLKVLEASGVVRTEKRGRERICRVEPQALELAENWIVKRRAGLEHRLERLAAHLGELDEPPPKRSRR
ncbi:MAG TPA: metalloregulator ArsR/SmtB family transcription factor [Polyangiaceae bacterium]|nr:metalloregulator ArsR/SmtB family transcription factor [Polyangiaceae bacterium]